MRREALWSVTVLEVWEVARHPCITVSLITTRWAWNTFYATLFWDRDEIMFMHKEFRYGPFLSNSMWIASRMTGRKKFIKI